MSKKSLVIAFGILANAASPICSQEFYIGAALGAAEVDWVEGASGDHISEVHSSSIMAGFRFDIGSHWFMGAELQSGNSAGYGSSYYGDPVGENAGINQAEIHVGYVGRSATFFGFVGAGQFALDDMGSIAEISGPTVFGLGAELDVTANISIRVETEFSALAVDDPCCSEIGAVEKRDISAGILFSF